MPMSAAYLATPLLFELHYDWLPSRCHDEWVHLRFCVRREVVTARMGGVDLHSALASELPSSQC